MGGIGMPPGRREAWLECARNEASHQIPKYGEIPAVGSRLVNSAPWSSCQGTKFFVLVAAVIVAHATLLLVHEVQILAALEHPAMLSVNNLQKTTTTMPA